MRTSNKAIANTRHQSVDVLRGAAILMMFAYHFAFDLNHFGFVSIDFYHTSFWIYFRTLIVALFITTMGISLHLATARGVDTRRFVRRLGLIAAAAALVSLATYFIFPRSWIFFGVLHFIAVATLLGLGFRKRGALNLFLGIGVLLLGIYFRHPVFDQPFLQWVGMMPQKPITEDYVPLVPWFSFVLFGLFLGQTLFDRSKVPAFASWRSKRGWARLLAFGGRHSLVIYLVHQPLFFGLLYLLTLLR